MKIGYIGLGLMGNPMSKNLVKNGYEVTVWNRTASRMQDLVKVGATASKSAAEVASSSEFIFTNVSDSLDVEEVVLGEGGIIEGATAGSVVIDNSTISPDVTKRIASKLSEKGVDMLDAPVSGGEPGAINATLAIMVGGEQEVFDQNFDLLKTMGGNVVLTGDIGAGGVTKLANQIIVAANIAGLSEALVLAQKAGVDPERVFNAIRGGLAGSAVMEAKGPMMLSRNFRAGFRVRLHQKDLRNVLQTAQELSVPLPVTSLLQQVLGALMNEGESESDHSVILKFVEDLAKIEVKAGG